MNFLFIQFSLLFQQFIQFLKLIFSIKLIIFLSFHEDPDQILLIFCIYDNLKDFPIPLIKPLLLTFHQLIFSKFLKSHILKDLYLYSEKNHLFYIFFTLFLNIFNPLRRSDILCLNNSISPNLSLYDIYPFANVFYYILIFS